MPEGLQARRRNSWLGCRKCSKQRGNGVMDQGDSSECTPGSSAVHTIYGRAGRSWERAAVGMGLLKNCFLGEKTGQGDRSGDGDQIEAEVAKRNRNWFGEQGQQRQKIHEDSKMGWREGDNGELEMGIWKL